MTNQEQIEHLKERNVTLIHVCVVEALIILLFLEEIIRRWMAGGAA